MKLSNYQSIDKNRIGKAFLLAESLLTLFLISLGLVVLFESQQIMSHKMDSQQAEVTAARFLMEEMQQDPINGASATKNYREGQWSYKVSRSSRQVIIEYSNGKVTNKMIMKR